MLGFIKIHHMYAEFLCFIDVCIFDGFYLCFNLLLRIPYLLFLHQMVMFKFNLLMQIIPKNNLFEIYVIKMVRKLSICNIFQSMF